jgi:putative hydrolase of the HAD superfamily
LTVAASPATTLFFDVGGVLLTNGRDRVARRRCIDALGLDREEFRDRHDFVAHDFETGRLDLDGYLDRTVFYRSRGFSRSEFVEAMQRQSAAIPGSLELLADLRAAGHTLIMLNNESRALNEYRIETFTLRRYFSAFLSSCYLGVKKPEPEIYRLALDLTQRRPETCLFIDDRALNVECAMDERLPSLRYVDPRQLRIELHDRLVLEP